MNSPALAALLSWLATTAVIHAAEGASALDALAALPPDAARRVSAIIGLEGNPNPERWRFLVWDVYAENGFREYVVADGKVVSKNIVSQFAVRVSPLEVMPPEAIQVDSDKVGWLAMQYAQVNDIPVSTLRYSLRRTPEIAAPVWKIDCFDDAEQQVGSISVAATEGKVLARLGFVNEPNQTALTPTPDAAASKKATSSRRSSSSKPVARRTGPPPEAIAERLRRAPTPIRTERKPFRLFRFGRD